MACEPHSSGCLYSPGNLKASLRAFLQQWKMMGTCSVVTWMRAQHGIPWAWRSRGFRNENEEVEVGRHEMPCRSGVMGHWNLCLPTGSTIFQAPASPSLSQHILCPAPGRWQLSRQQPVPPSHEWSHAHPINLDIPLWVTSAVHRWLRSRLNFLFLSLPVSPRQQAQRLQEPETLSEKHTRRGAPDEMLLSLLTSTTAASFPPIVV